MCSFSAAREKFFVDSDLQSVLQLTQFHDRSNGSFGS